MSNKTSFLGLSLLDTSSENSTHFKDWSRNINLEGDEDNKSDFQKIDEFAQKITKDLEERPAGVSSWNDLEDKPFGETTTEDGETVVKTIDPKYLPSTMGDLTFTVNDNGIVTVTFADK